MASKFFNMTMLLIISMFVGTIITSPIDVSSKSSEDLLLKAALESMNVNLSNYHVYKNGQLIDPEQLMTVKNISTSEMLLKNYDPNANRVDKRIKRELYDKDMFDDQIGDKYLNKILEQEIKNGYEGNFPIYKIERKNISCGIQFTITYYKSSYINCSTSWRSCSCKLVCESVCRTIVEHRYDSEISLRNIVHSDCKNV